MRSFDEFVLNFVKGYPFEREASSDQRRETADERSGPRRLSAGRRRRSVSLTR